MNLKKELLVTVDALNHASVQYALCGGMAVVLHGHPRLTRDIDILIRPEDLDKARNVLAEVGFTLTGGIIPFDTGGPHERKVFRVSKVFESELLTIDLILLPPFLREIWADVETYEVEGADIHVVSRKGLIEMKRIAGRQQDLADIEWLQGKDNEGQ